MSRNRKALTSQLSKNVRRAGENARLYKLLPLQNIKPNPTQPRKHFTEESIRDLAASIQQVGLINPIVIKADGTIVAGERRYRACQKIKLETVPVWILPSQHDSIHVSLIENLQREDLHPLEESIAFHSILEEGVLQEELGKKIGKSKVYMSESLSLLRLDESIRNEWVHSPELASKYIMIQVSRLETSEQLEKWEAIKSGTSTVTVQKQIKKSRTERSTSPRPQSVFSRIRKTRDFCHEIQISTWKEQTKNKLRDELEETIAALEELRRKIDQIPEE